MGTDFLELFKYWEDPNEANEEELYKFIKAVHKLIQTGNRDSIPNVLRKYYECILYKCGKAKIKLIYKDDRKDKKYVDVANTSKLIFAKEPDFYRNTINKFLEKVNAGSHCDGVGYASIKSNELNPYIDYAIDIWNWYAKRVRNLDDKYLIKKMKKYDFPDVINLNMFEDKIESKNARIQTLQDKLEETKTENRTLQDKLEEIYAAQEEEDKPLDIPILEQDILQTIKDFIANRIYCTHRTIALFLLGDKIPQTEFKNLTEFELFGKYSKKKFSEHEYNLSLQNLVNQEKIIQIGAYYNLYDKNMNVVQKWLLVLKTRFYRWSGTKVYKTKINKEYIKIIQKAIDEHKNIELTYCKPIPNSDKKEITNRILKPEVMVPKDNRDDIKNNIRGVEYADELFYLGAVDLNDKEVTSPKTFRLDYIRNPKILS